MVISPRLMHLKHLLSAEEEKEEKGGKKKSHNGSGGGEWEKRQFLVCRNELRVMFVS